jgi:hypothetical protein
MGWCRYSSSIILNLGTRGMYFYTKNTTFQKLILLPLSGKEGMEAQSVESGEKQKPQSLVK